MRKLLLLPLFIFIFVVSSLLWGYQNIQPPTTSGTKKDFLIVKGTSASSIAANLKKEGLVKSSLAFRLYVQLTNNQRKIQAGAYELKGNVNLFKMVDQLLKGPSEIWVTVPEGFRHEQTAERFAESLEKDGEFIKEFLTLAKPQEGFLYPDTYLFPKEATPTMIVNRMKSVFDQKTDDLDEGIQASGYSLNQIVTMASILERETLNDAEKPIVAGILFKRYRNGWPLQADATAQYLAGTQRCSGKLDCEWWQPPTSADLAINSRYNTYKFQGLPPGPIASPGIVSIKAAVSPEESDYWYYLHDPDGEIHYARTLEEHNENIQKYLGR